MTNAPRSDFAGVDAAAAPGQPAIRSCHLPDGRRKATEWLAKNSTRRNRRRGVHPAVEDRTRQAQIGDRRAVNRQDRGDARLRRLHGAQLAAHHGSVVLVDDQDPAAGRPHARHLSALPRADQGPVVRSRQFVEHLRRAFGRQPLRALAGNAGSPHGSNRHRRQHR